MTTLEDQPLKSTNPEGPIVFFATPAYHGLSVWYVDSLLNATRDLNAHGFRVQHYFQRDCPLITNAREELLGMFLASKAEWMVMVDNDIGWPRDLVRRMIAFGEPMMIAGVPYRSIDVEKIEAGTYSDGLAFNTTTPEILADRPQRDGFVKVDGAGTAFFVIRRAAVESMARRYADLEIQINHVKTWALFAQLIQQKTHMGEDTSFFRRWTLMGGEIWCCLDADITHEGPVIVGGNLGRKMEGVDDPMKRWVRGSPHKAPGTGLPTDPTAKTETRGTKGAEWSEARPKDGPIEPAPRLLEEGAGAEPTTSDDPPKT